MAGAGDAPFLSLWPLFSFLRYPLAVRAHRGVAWGVWEGLGGVVDGRSRSRSSDGGALVGAPACDKGVLDSPDNYEMYEIPFVWVIYESRQAKKLSGLFATRDVLWRAWAVLTQAVDCGVRRRQRWSRHNGQHLLIKSSQVGRRPPSTVRCQWLGGACFESFYLRETSLAPRG